MDIDPGKQHGKRHDDCEESPADKDIAERAARHGGQVVVNPAICQGTRAAVIKRCPRSATCKFRQTVWSRARGSRARCRISPEAVRKPAGSNCRYWPLDRTPSASSKLCEFPLGEAAGLLSARSSRCQIVLHISRILHRAWQRGQPAIYLLRKSGANVRFRVPMTESRQSAPGHVASAPKYVVQVSRAVSPKQTCDKRGK